MPAPGGLEPTPRPFSLLVFFCSHFFTLSFQPHPLCVSSTCFFVCVRPPSGVRLFVCRVDLRLGCGIHVATAMVLRDENNCFEA